MFARNLSVYPDVTHEACEFIRTIKWRNDYFTHSVYTNVLITGIFNAVIFPFTTFFNGAFILCVFSDRPLRRHKSVLLLGLLATTDLLVGVVIQPMFVASALCRITQVCKFSQEISSAVCFLVAISSYSSFFHTSLIACDRYVAIKHALRYKVLVTTNKLRLGTMIAWILSVLLTCMFSFISEAKKIVMIFMFVVLAVDIYFYVIICLESRRLFLEKCHSAVTPGQERKNLNQKREFKAAKKTALIFGCLLLCYGPSYWSQFISNYILPMNSSNVSVWLCVFLWTRTLMMVNSLCNVFIYKGSVPRFRKNILGILNTRCSPTTNVRDTRGPMQMFNQVESNRVADGLQKVTEKPPHLINMDEEEQNFKKRDLQLTHKGFDAKTKMNNSKEETAETCSNTKKCMHENKTFFNTKL